PVRAAEHNLPQVYKNLCTNAADGSASTAKYADGTPNTTGLVPAFMPRYGEYYTSGYHLHCAASNIGCAPGGFFVNPGPGIYNGGVSLEGPVVGISGHRAAQARTHRGRFQVQTVQRHVARGNKAVGHEGGPIA
ncbi:hypothetical protein PZH32_11590, partial [Adlercreutzia equolifaciens]|uniref:hypothetical protein n=1 Tax=Adlercreutzia equolifaciens TaxID=446660 RepID=UPI0023B01201